MLRLQIHLTPTHGDSLEYPRWPANGPCPPPSVPTPTLSCHRKLQAGGWQDCNRGFTSDPPRGYCFPGPKPIQNFFHKDHAKNGRKLTVFFGYFPKSFHLFSAKNDSFWAGGPRSPALFPTALFPFEVGRHFPSKCAPKH